MPGAAAAVEWSVWSTTARLVVTEPGALAAAREIVVDHLAAVDEVASRFRADAEINQLDHADGTPQRISPLLADLVGAALLAARRTDGDVDPTVGGPLAALGYDRDITLLPSDGPRLRVVHRPAPGWQRIRLTGNTLTLPDDARLDLGATAKAQAADRCAALVAERLDTGVLVSLGGDVATAGNAPEGGWRIRVQDRPGEPACTITLAAGSAVATSSTLGRRWRRGGRLLHHILDPRTCQPAPVVWRTATVAAASCLDANTASTAAIVRGSAAVGWLRRLGMPARLVATDGSIVTTAGWPAPSRAKVAGAGVAGAGVAGVRVDRAETAPPAEDGTRVTSAGSATRPRGSGR
ncbi:membrane-associated lipoprotein involved in thiamine biosynthesis [Frankia casuarinae]|uniref:FAD:protein FMN transferase n=1 Tax=Frankia casuarinae (strain DSM 45818 / CECT 9043 / HFP020203 / CcI3) TaxID=106370 RepID=Q2J9U5_FRACC|nr:MULTISPECIES: FAD:protein FMN transferase [Frankia]ABD11947.1 ApbE-like lipoprotein [Frankia casuarinae]ETA00200.1 membrane-associated lipoprotein involved in thiamine biosynthesis [Frankia sp. CcI6]EYT90976.1 membrane-associated lipoprotein involved in thiamine biosynthesis [Frankia casuarinae]KDA41555.1 membrane-associated lipoprotein involved in thiamine biosynthesis [Frankia sp. BMG5.23]KEZ34980.1 membrane-associated lipoprotein involved in thiamine biosynthesis [Frankia sp. CeD]